MSKGPGLGKGIVFRSCRMFDLGRDGLGLVGGQDQVIKRLSVEFNFIPEIRSHR